MMENPGGIDITGVPGQAIGVQIPVNGGWGILGIPGVTMGAIGTTPSASSRGGSEQLQYAMQIVQRKKRRHAADIAAAAWLLLDDE